MAKRIGVLEVDEPLSAEPRIFVKKSVAQLMIRRLEARRLFDESGQLITQLIQMVKVKVREAIQEIRAYCNGPLGVGNAIPFSAPTDPQKHYHYEIPMAGDIGYWRHHRRRIWVSARTTSIQTALAYLRTTNNPRLASPSL